MITAPRKKLKYGDKSPLSHDSAATPEYYETLRNAPSLPPPYDNRVVAHMLTDLAHMMYKLAEYVYANNHE